MAEALTVFWFNLLTFVNPLLEVLATLATPIRVLPFLATNPPSDTLATLLPLPISVLLFLGTNPPSDNLAILLPFPITVLPSGAVAPGVAPTNLLLHVGPVVCCSCCSWSCCS